MTTETTGIRRATSRDAASLTSVRQAARRAETAVWPREVSWTSRISAPGVYTYLAEHHQVFGMVTTGPPEEDYFADGQTGEILEWYVHPAQWHQGTGRKLLVHGMTVIKRRLCERALVWMPELAARGFKCMTGAGFEYADAEKEDNTGGPPVKLLAFVRDLSDFF